MATRIPAPCRSPEQWMVLLDSLMPHGGGKRVLQTVSQDAALSTRHSYVLLTARTRLSLPVLELAEGLSVPVVRKPFDLEVLAFDSGPGPQPGRGRSAGLKAMGFLARFCKTGISD